MHKSFFALILAILLVSSCGKIELPSDNNGNGGGGTPSTPTNSDSVYAVQDLAKIDNEDIVYVKGYIVGYIPKSGSMARTIFSVSEADISATNIVLADTPTETDYHKCAPMQLLANSEARIQLNLSDNPDNLGKLVVLCGKRQIYYNYPGLKPVYSYLFSDDDSGSSGEEPPSETPISFPTINTEESEVFDGC